MLTYKDLGSGTPIVLLHGLGSTKEAWVSQHELANKYRLIIPDLRGHGETVINENFTIKNFALDIIQLIEHLNILEPRRRLGVVDKRGQLPRPDGLCPAGHG